MAEFADVVHELVRDGCDLSLRQADALLLCYRNPDPGGRTVRHLHAVMKVSKPAVTRALDKLEAEAYGTRKIDPLDRRLIIFTLTPKGRAFAERVEGARRKAA